ncbi:hypothetical protein HDU76_012937 [Blyttiomyces sp. JEL0837]|nr:hypothetical protein HDU76_012937 [Blyttiomyces sp. JEL0837]
MPQVTVNPPVHINFSSDNLVQVYQKSAYDLASLLAKEYEKAEEYRKSAYQLTDLLAAEHEKCVTTQLEMKQANRRIEVLTKDLEDVTNASETCAEALRKVERLSAELEAEKEKAIRAEAAQKNAAEELKKMEKTVCDLQTKLNIASEGLVETRQKLGEVGEEKDNLEATMKLMMAEKQKAESLNVEYASELTRLQDELAQARQCVIQTEGKVEAMVNERDNLRLSVKPITDAKEKVDSLNAKNTVIINNLKQQTRVFENLIEAKDTLLKQKEVKIMELQTSLEEARKISDEKGLLMEVKNSGGKDRKNMGDGSEVDVQVGGTKKRIDSVTSKPQYKSRSLVVSKAGDLPPLPTAPSIGVSRSSSIPSSPRSASSSGTSVGRTLSQSSFPESPKQEPKKLVASSTASRPKQTTKAESSSVANDVSNNGFIQSPESTEKTSTTSTATVNAATHEKEKENALEEKFTEIGKMVEAKPQKARKKGSR